MKNIGLIGGVSPASTLRYYKAINDEVNRKLGAHHSAKIILVSVDFDEIVKAIFINDWATVEDILLDAALKLQQAGADFILICSNTLYKVLPKLRRKVYLPIIHVLEPVCHSILKNDLKKILLLGTCFTMQENFHKDYLQRHGVVEVVVPRKKDQLLVNEIIFQELCYDIVTNDSRQAILNIIYKCQKEYGIEGVVLGCTELPLLLPFVDCEIPLFDTTNLHAELAANRAIVGHYKDTQEISQSKCA